MFTFPGNRLKPAQAAPQAFRRNQNTDIMMGNLLSLYAPVQTSAATAIGSLGGQLTWSVLFPKKATISASNYTPRYGDTVIASPVDNPTLWVRGIVYSISWLTQSLVWSPFHTDSTHPFYSSNYGGWNLLVIPQSDYSTTYTLTGATQEIQFPMIRMARINVQWLGVTFDTGTRALRIQALTGSGVADTTAAHYPLQTIASFIEPATHGTGVSESGILTITSGSDSASFVHYMAGYFQGTTGYASNGPWLGSAPIWGCKLLLSGSGNFSAGSVLVWVTY